MLILKGLALDGAFLRANASKNTLIMKKTTQRDLKEVDTNIDEYLSALKYSDEETHATALIMFTYNFKRLLNLIGIALFKKLLIALKDGDTTKIREEIEAHVAISGLYMLNFLLNIFMLQFSKKFA